MITLAMVYAAKRAKQCAADTANASAKTCARARATGPDENVTASAIRIAGFGARAGAPKTPMCAAGTVIVLVQILVSARTAGMVGGVPTETAASAPGSHVVANTPRARTPLVVTVFPTFAQHAA